MTQYTLSTSLPSSTYRDYVLSYVGLMDHYVLMQTGQYDYTAYVWGPSKNLEIQFYREQYTSSGFSGQYRWRTDVIERTGTRQISVFEPLYCYSSESEYGIYTAPQTYTYALSVSSVLLFLSVAVCVVFRFMFRRRHLNV